MPQNAAFSRDVHLTCEAGKAAPCDPRDPRDPRAWRGVYARRDVVCSDAGAPSNLAGSQGYFATHEEATAAALIAGVDSFTDHDQDSSVITGRLRRALDQGLADQIGRASCRARV